MSRRLHAVMALAAAVVVTAACSRRMDMYDQPRYEAQEASRFFADGKAARDPIPGTVARGWLREDSHFYRGRTDDSTLVYLPQGSFPAEPIETASRKYGSDPFVEADA